MMYADDIVKEYFEWMFDLVCRERYSKEISYRKLLMHLHSTEFRYSILRDENRAKDGEALRYEFVYQKGYDGALVYLDDRPSSILEMMIALSIRCEEFMDDTNIGDRTAQWFWGMITNLGLGSMTDDRFDKRMVNDTLDRFLDREYEPDGRGGLFRVRNCDRDLRKVEIWYQLCWYLDSIV